MYDADLCRRTTGAEINMYSREYIRKKVVVRSHHPPHTIKMLDEIMTVGSVLGVDLDPVGDHLSGPRSFVGGLDPDSLARGRDDQTTALGYLDSLPGLGLPMVQGHFVCSVFAILLGQEGHFVAAVVQELEAAGQAGSAAAAAGVAVVVAGAAAVAAVAVVAADYQEP